MIDIKELIEQNRSGRRVGLPSFCTANEHVLRAILEYMQEHKVPAIIEATCNQVNQDGGYTGLTAVEFVDWMRALAAEYHVSDDALILGGDHLGPNPWRDLAATEAMDKAEKLVQSYAAAGFRKIHLDASMACGGEPTPSFELVAERAARLCRVAENHAPDPQKLIYVLGTEVPIPGGETDDMDDLAVTTTERFLATVSTHQEAFEREGLAKVWPRIVSIVTQPGVDFSHTAVHRFEPSQVTDLSNAMLTVPDLCFEAHSTDYQPTIALEELVANHFFFLKVGPELTFRMREAAFALASLEQLLPVHDVSNLIPVIDKTMSDDRADWEQYYSGDADTVKQLRHYSYSDRIRYYWARPQVQQALDRLISNLENSNIPETMISQYFPMRSFGDLKAGPRALLADQIKMTVARYYQACGL